jgi:hypothetical protein
LGALGALLVIAGLGAFLWWDGDPEMAVGGTEAAGPRPERSQAQEESSGGGTELLSPPVVEYPDDPIGPTTVLWPLRVELDLVQAVYLPTEEGVEPIGTGLTARLSGAISGANDLPSRAEIRFVEGPNEGRVLRTDATGAFGAADLFPGLSIVEVRGSAISGSRREVRLRQNQETLLNIGYGRPASLVGFVEDNQGTPLEGASVSVDGTKVFSGADGKFYAVDLAGGEVLVEVEKPGFADHQEIVSISAGRINHNVESPLTFNLTPAAQLTLVVKGNAGGPGPVQVHLFPARGSERGAVGSLQRRARFPWERRNPIEVWPERPVTIDGLPREVISVAAFRSGAIAPKKNVNLTSDRSVEIPLEPAPKLTGRVLDLEREPVGQALVRLEAPNRVRSTLDYFKEMSWFLETSVIATLPPALQQVTCDAQGRFVLTSWEEIAPVRYIEARSPDGRAFAGELVRAGTTEVELVLREANLSASSLAIELSKRFQGLPVEILVNGTPYDPFVLPPEKPLVITGLLAGRWRLTASWKAQELAAPMLLDVRGEAHAELALPEAAVRGQDEEEWKRAGRFFPNAASGEGE